MSARDKKTVLPRRLRTVDGRYCAEPRLPEVEWPPASPCPVCGVAVFPGHTDSHRKPVKCGQLRRKRG